MLTLSVVDDFTTSTIFFGAEMAYKASLLTIPLELRRQVYSYLLIHDSVVNVAGDTSEKRIRDG